MKKERILTLMISTLLVISSVSSMKTVESEDYFFGLRILALSPLKQNPDYGLFISQQLREINIDSEVIVPSGRPNWLDYLSQDYPDWNMALCSAGEVTSRDMRDYYTENGSKNIFRLNSEIPYNNESEALQNLAVSTTDPEAIFNHLWDWQILFMDKILALLPTFSPRAYEAVWANTMSYEARWGIADSLPYMYYDGLHNGQQNLSEFNIATPNWRNLNPLFTITETEELLYDMMSEPLLVMSPDLAILKTGLVADWFQVDDSHYIFELRDNVYWNPSYNITARNATSVPLSLIPDEDLLVGSKGEFSNGTNQQVTAEDAVFSLLAHSNSNISSISHQYSWLSNCYVDPADDLRFHVIIDGDPETPEKDIYVDFWPNMHVPILPEFFLNSTTVILSQTNGGQEYIGLYPDIINTAEWLSFSSSAFGCGKYMLDYDLANSVTVLQKNPNWFGVGAIDGTAQDLDIETLNVRIIPDISAALAEFKAGKLDWIILTPFPTERKNMQDQNIRLDIQSYVTFEHNFIAFNLNRPIIGGADNLVWLDEPGKTNCTKALAIRKAICYAINRDEINSEIHDGEYLVSHSPNPRIPNPYYGLDPFRYDHDLDKAWEWMEAAGFERPYTPTPTPTSSETIPTLKTIKYPEIFVLIGFVTLIIYYRKRIRNNEK